MGGVDHDHPVVDGPHLSVDGKKRQTGQDMARLQCGILIVLMGFCLSSDANQC